MAKIMEVKIMPSRYMKRSERREIPRAKFRVGMASEPWGPNVESGQRWERRGQDGSVIFWKPTVNDEGQRLESGPDLGDQVNGGLYEVPFLGKQALEREPFTEAMLLRVVDVWVRFCQKQSMDLLAS